jgi:hypothetical protein
MDLHQGDCILLNPDAIAAQPPATRPPDLSNSPSDPLFQVIGVDSSGERCWVRRWPLVHRGSPVFEVALDQVRGPAPHRPSIASRRDG